MAAHLPRRLLLLAWPKSNQKPKTEKSFSPQGHTPGPLFCRATARFYSRVFFTHNASFYPSPHCEARSNRELYEAVAHSGSASVRLLRASQ
ncbi:hypothetical protein HYN43_003450 [Mucilaginibacter celer]|uniref:Uncharacterized protein n=1 Tax=Mucilaginibacter celer TaxID=2305508 RepID=A0A494VLH9_9SPHI|nr:hypothetical protein HYN43_003450 [Mucilaginibacter celer]